MTGLDEILRILNQGGTVAVLVLIILGGYRQWWVWGWQFHALEEDRDRWKELALSGTDLAERLASAPSKHSAKKARLP